MKRLLSTLAVALAVVVTAAAEETKEKAAFDPGKLIGVWTITSGVRGGEKVDKEHLQGKVSITKDTITLQAGPDQKFVFAYKIDPKAKPATIDMEIKEGPVPDAKAIGIVGWDGESFKLCYVVKGDGDSKRPTKFESPKDSNSFFFVLKPAAKK